jgi:hypothetical protein
MLAQPFVALFGVERASKYDMAFGTPSVFALLQEKGGPSPSSGPTQELPIPQGTTLTLA